MNIQLSVLQNSDITKIFSKLLWAADNEIIFRQVNFSFCI